MKNTTALIALFVFSLSSYAGFDGIDGVYGTDNRQDVFEVKNELHKKLAKSTAALIKGELFFSSGKQNSFNISFSKTLEVVHNLCPSERFSQQLAVADCSGFLVSQDVIVTAGHCYSGDYVEKCKNKYWVFDYSMKSAKDDVTRNIPLKNLYSCKQVIKVNYGNGLDYAIIKLDRKVVGREPLNFRKAGKIAGQTELVTIGHPSGLPTKITDAGNITNNDATETFSTNLDTFAGNSGSAVFNSKTGVIEGILIQGKPDYLPYNKNNPNSCMVVNTCDNNARKCAKDYYGQTAPTRDGEVVLRITKVAKDIEAAIKL